MTVSRKEKNTPMPHDAVFRAFMASAEVARDFVELHLPEEYLQLYDVPTRRVYHGEWSPYLYRMNLPACFRNPEAAAKIYTRPFHLVDVTLLDDNEIMLHRRMGH